jgi:hypothetical protein
VANHHSLTRTALFSNSELISTALEYLQQHSTAQEAAVIMADLNDTQTADLSSEVAAMPPTPSEGKTKRARARGADTQATRTACAQPALELWQQYTPAPIPTTLQSSGMACWSMMHG